MKLLFENWRKFMNEDDKTDAEISSARQQSMRKGMDALLGEDDEESDSEVEKALDKELDKEGGASGFDLLFKAAQKIDPDITKDEVKQMLDGMSNAKQHEEGDWIDVAQIEEAASVYLEAKQIVEQGSLQELDRCAKKAKSTYKVWPSAYASGAAVRCRQGEIWKT
jgi:hypothetical protein